MCSLRNSSSPEDAEPLPTLQGAPAETLRDAAVRAHGVSAGAPRRAELLRAGPSGVLVALDRPITFIVFSCPPLPSPPALPLSSPLLPPFHGRRSIIQKHIYLPYNMENSYSYLCFSGLTLINVICTAAPSVDLLYESCTIKFQSSLRMRLLQ